MTCAHWAKVFVFEDPIAAAGAAFSRNEIRRVRHHDALRRAILTLPRHARTAQKKVRDAFIPSKTSTERTVSRTGHRNYST